MNTRSRRRRQSWVARSTALFAVLTLGAGVVACGGDESSTASSDSNKAGDSAEAGKLTKVRGGILTSASHLPIMVAKDEGIFERNGIDMELTVVQNIAALPGAMGRQFDFGSTTIPDVIKAQKQGIDVVVSANLGDETGTNKLVGLVVGKDSGIKAPADLEGKTVGVLTLGGNIHPATLVWLQSEGVDTKKVKFIEVPPPNHPDQLNSGTIDASETIEPFLGAMLAKGHTELAAPMLAVSDPAAVTSWMSSRKWVEENPETVAAVVKSLREAAEFISENEDRAREILAKHSGIPPEVAKNVKLPVFETQIPADQVAAWADALVTIGELDGSAGDIDPASVLAIPE